MSKRVLKWLNYLAIGAGVVAIVVLTYGIIRTLV